MVASGVVGGCSCERSPVTDAVDGGTDAQVDAASLDSGPDLDAEPPRTDGDATDADSGTRTDPADAGAPIGCDCPTPLNPCLVGACQDGACVQLPVDDGTPCPVDDICVAGVCTEPRCGDGYREPAGGVRPREACDDGNDIADDGCDASCTVTDIQVAARPRSSDSRPAVAIREDGTMAVVWTSRVDAAEPLLSMRLRVHGPHGDVWCDIELETGAGLGSVFSPSVTATAEGWAVAWRTSRAAPGARDLGDIALAIVRDDGVVVSLVRANEEVEGEQRSPSVAWSRDALVVGWESLASARTEVTVQLRDARGRVVGAALAPFLAGPAFAPQLAAGADAWSIGAVTGTPLTGVIRTYSADATAAPVSVGSTTALSISRDELGTVWAAWVDRRTDPQGEIAAASFVGADRVVEHMLAQPGRDDVPRITATPRGPVILWTHGDLSTRLAWPATDDPPSELTALAESLSAVESSDGAIASGGPWLAVAWTERDRAGALEAIVARRIAMEVP